MKKGFRFAALALALLMLLPPVLPARAEKTEGVVRVLLTRLGLTDRMEVSAFGNDERMILAARFDNLGKGASGAAIQNMNLLLGADETAGLII